MDFLTITLSLLLAAGALALILYPVWQSRARDLFSGQPTQPILENYEARYQAALAAIKELMFDYEMGKVAEEDYQLLLTKAKLEAAQLRQQIDRLHHQQQATVEIDAALDAEIEKLIAQTRAGQSNGSQALLREVEAEIELLKGLASAHRACPNCGRLVGDTDAFCSGCGHALEDLAEETPSDDNTCPQCGFAVQPDDAFCAHCGTPLRATAPEPTEKASL